MTFSIQFFGATEQVTGSLYVLRTDQHTVLLECGLIQGSRKSEAQNKADFPVPVDEIDAVVLSHAHIDHSGRIPLLFKRGYQGPIYTHRGTLALSEIMLPDSGYLNEKDAEWENKHREKKGLDPIEALYTRDDAKACLRLFRGVEYGETTEILPGLFLNLHDAGHILGSAIVEMRCKHGDKLSTLVFSGDLGYAKAPVMNPPAQLQSADLVVMESTYGDRMHRPFDETIAELGEVFDSARASRGNVVIPAFTVGRTQDLLYLMKEHEHSWRLKSWQVYLDSPMAIDATEAYARYRDLYGAQLFSGDSTLPPLPNIFATRSTEESMTINSIKSGAIIIAGSGMCTGGRIHHHLKYNIWRPECHVVIVGYQADGTLGRQIVDGADEIRLWGEEYKVRATVHTIGGLSAHADQAGLVDWYRHFESKPPVYLVHGEERSQIPLTERLETELRAPVTIARQGMRVDIG